ncbi:hypothetical protein NC653_024900 [Populus alba x Populus x berolinensis]|uniref:Uncharacterized protein n=1 Tax=Populus alba x Populus x berolinensis TaxID=444605 RepID=A0AAD6MA06_9ROSI|nr:hypothetical protein NC653_024900 [Populus alba x Populus x berolinensis]
MVWLAPAPALRLRLYICGPQQYRSCGLAELSINGE